MKSITVQLEDITKFATEGGKLIFTPKAEDSLLSLLALKDKIEEAIELAKKDIMESGRKVFPDFKAVKGKRISVSIREYGDRYAVDGKPSDEFIRQIVTERVNADKVAEYEQAEGKLPEGIKTNERIQKVVISIKKDETYKLP